MTLQAKILMDQLATSFPIHPPPTKPPIMEETMKICEEMERRSEEQIKETTKIIEEPKDSDLKDNYEHVEGGLKIDLDEVASDEEGHETHKDVNKSKFDTL